MNQSRAGLVRHADRKDVIKVKRREFVALIGAAATAGPAIARGQIAATRRPLVAILTQRSPEAMRRYVNAFAQGMQELGLVAQRDYEIVLRSTDGDATRAPQLLQELIGLGPQVILTTDTTLALAAKRATKVIPIVGVLIAAPVAFGLVASLARPGGNVTGLLSSVDRLPAKQLQLLLRIVPGATRIGLLLNVDNPANVGGVRLLETDAAVRQLKFVSAAIARRPRSILYSKASRVSTSRRYSCSKTRCLRVMQNGLRHWRWQRGSRPCSGSESWSKPAG